MHLYRLVVVPIYLCTGTRLYQNDVCEVQCQTDTHSFQYKVITFIKLHLKLFENPKLGNFRILVIKVASDGGRE